MVEQDEQYNKILQFLRSRNSQDVVLGIQLLKSTLDADLITQFLSNKSYISSMIVLPLIPLFQENPKLWKTIQQKIPPHIAQQILMWLPFTILELDPATIDSFCALANKKVWEYFPNFPILDVQLLTKHESYYYCSIKSGREVVDGIGWSLYIESKDVGPAEVIHEEIWRAIAQHPDFSIKIERTESTGTLPNIWLVKIPTPIV